MLEPLGIFFEIQNTYLVRLVLNSFRSNFGVKQSVLPSPLGELTLVTESLLNPLVVDDRRTDAEEVEIRTKVKLSRGLIHLASRIWFLSHQKRCSSPHRRLYHALSAKTDGANIILFTLLQEATFKARSVSLTEEGGGRGGMRGKKGDEERKWSGWEWGKGREGKWH